MKTWTSSLPLVAIAAVAILNVVACDSDPKKSKEVSDKVAVKENGIEKPMADASASRIDKLPDGLYRLAEVRMQADFKVPKTDKFPETKVSMAASQTFVAKAVRGEKFDAALATLNRGNSTDHEERSDINITLSPKFKVPLTIRVHQGEVAFEQLRSFWLCIKNKLQCEREHFLSEGTSPTADVIHPAKYLVTKGLGSRGADVATQIQSMITSGDSSRLWIELQSPLSDNGASPLTVRLTFKRDAREYLQDRQGNSDEESLRTSEPAP